jgi:hypothetical protein
MNSKHETIPKINNYNSRLEYDDHYVKTEIKQSTDQIKYITDPNRAARRNICLPTDVGWFGHSGVSYDTSRKLVDTESMLRTLDQPYSKFPGNKHQPTNLHEYDRNMYHFNTCKAEKDYTRYSNPSCSFKEWGKNRTDILYMNHQDEDKWLHPDRNKLSARLVMKDKHVARVPKMLDDSSLYPNSKREQI